MGLPGVRLARLEAYIRVVQGLLQGETVEWSEEGGTHKIRFLNPELGLINLDDPIALGTRASLISSSECDSRHVCRKQPSSPASTRLARSQDTG